MSDDSEDGSEDNEAGGIIPTRLLGAEVFALDPESEVGLMVIESDAFDARIAINRDGAEALRNALNRFLEGGAPAFPSERHN